MRSLSRRRSEGGCLKGRFLWCTFDDWTFFSFVTGGSDDDTMVFLLGFDPTPNNTFLPSSASNVNTLEPTQKQNRHLATTIPSRSILHFSLLVNKKTQHHRLDDVPDVLGRVAELAASHTGTEREVADRDRVVLVLVGEVVVSLGHGSDKDADALLGAEVRHIVADSHNGSVEGKGNLAAVRG